MMLAQGVLEIVDRLDASGVRVWLDGGWGVDASIGHQTPDHEDLDPVIPLPAADAARRALTALGFRLTEDEATLCFVARDARDRQVDVHTVVFDKEGGGPPTPGRRRVLALPVLCHLNHEPDETDRRDMKLLAESRHLPP